MNKLLSIIIPSYNVGQYLAKGLESLNIPEWRDQLEVLIVNDGSTDNTSAIGHEFETRYPGIYRVIDKSNGNYGSCMNRGLEESRGTFVKVMDGDDSFDSAGLVELMKELVRFESEESEIDAVLVNADFIDGTGRRWTHCFAIDRNSPVPVYKPFGLDDIQITEPIAMHMIVYRKSIFDRFNYRQTEGVSYTDLEWRLLPMTQVRKVYAVPVVVYLYLVGRNGQTMNPVTYAQKFQVVANLVKHIVDEYEKLKDKSRNLGYVQRSIQYQVDMAYFTALCGWHEYDAVVDVKDFDDYIKRTGPEFYAKARNKEMRFSRFPLSVFSFYPTRVWDRWHTVNAPRLLAHRLYKRFFKRGAVV